MKILHRYSGEVIFEAEVASMKELVELAVKNKVSLVGVDLSDANLMDAYLKDADLSGADLSGADLRGAVLGYADLRDADLRNIVLLRREAQRYEL